jgi:uncharacterized membrane protein YqjE
MVFTAGQESRTTDKDRSVGELVGELSEEIRRLATAEAKLAVTELRRKAKRAGLGAGMLGAAGLFGVIGLMVLVACAVLALALVLPAWLSALIVGAAALVVAGMSALMGRAALRRATPVTPEWAMSSVREDLEAIKKGVQK